jgi:xanthine dehydrogenase large subunit
MSHSLVGKNIPHDSAVTHVTGKSLFIDDIPLRTNELHLALVGSPVAHGRIRSIDIEAAKKLPNIVAIYTHKDIPGHNAFGPVAKDEHLLASDETVYIGDPIVLNYAYNRESAIAARKTVKLDVEPLKPIFSIDEAIAANNFLAPERIIETGDITAAFAAAENIRESTLVIGGQEHFYLESQAAIAYPDEQNTMLVLSSTQHPTEVQSIVAEILGVPFNHVTVQCKRMGGGFGGKETQAAGPAAMAALAAKLTGRPARIVLDRDTDMAFTGKRHPFKAWYKVAFTSAG